MVSALGVNELEPHQIAESFQMVMITEIEMLVVVFAVVGVLLRIAVAVTFIMVLVVAGALRYIVMVVVVLVMIALTSVGDGACGGVKSGGDWLFLAMVVVVKAE